MSTPENISPIAKSTVSWPFDDITSRFITPHSVGQMQNLLDSLDSNSQTSRDDFLSFFVQSIFHSFLHPSIRPQHNNQLPLIQNMPTRDGMQCLVKDQWPLPSLNGDSNDKVYPPNPSPIHHRIVCLTELIGRRLEDFSTVREFISAIRDASQAHAEVSKHCNWIHGDITPLNILIDRNGKGVLTDWDHKARNKKTMTTEKTC